VDPDELLGVALTHAWSRGEVRLWDLTGQAEHGPERSDRDLRHTRVGRIGLPLGAYERALKAVEAAAHGGPAPEGPGLWHAALLFERGAEPVAAAMRDRYHWGRLYSTVLPVEPELIAAGLGMLRVWRQAGQAGEILLQRVQSVLRDPFAMTPLQLAIELGG
jgi:hypothetical protein